jgi:hypothetical protein
VSGAVLKWLSLATAMVAPVIAFAQERTRPVTFPPGATSTTLKGVIRGDASIAYNVPLADGQLVQALFRPSNRSCYMNVTPPGAAEAVHVGSINGNEFAQNPAAPGIHTVQIYLMRNAARRGEACRYSLSLEITGKPGGISAGIPDVALRDACRANAAKMYGVEPRRIRVMPIRAGVAIPAPGAAALPPPAFQAEATANKGREGVKKLRCLFKADRSLDRIMALTPDGE